MLSGQASQLAKGFLSRGGQSWGVVFNSDTTCQGERPPELNRSALVLSSAGIWKLGQPTLRTIWAEQDKKSQWEIHSDHRVYGTSDLTILDLY